MDTTTQSPPPKELVDTDNHQSPAGSPPAVTVSSLPSPVEEVDHQQELINSNLPYSPSLNSVKRQLREYSHLPSPEYSVDGRELPPPEESDGQGKPPMVDVPLPEEEQIIDYQLPPSPPPTVPEQPPENPNPSSNRESKQPPLEQPPSPLPLDPPENPISNPKAESPISKPPPSVPEVQPESPDFDACFDNEPPKKIDSPSRKEPYSPDFDACFDREPPLPENPRKIQSPKPYSPDLDSIFDGDPNETPKDVTNPKNPHSDHESLYPSPSVKHENSLKPHQSPKEDMTRPQPPLGVPLLLDVVTSASPIRPQISAWTHEETVNLIQAYQEKWYSIKKGPLKAGQWEEVAVTVAARCGYDEPTKTSKQCRHKLEKLRKRYRAERGNSRSKANAWSFFKMMDNLEKGPLPISSSPMALVEYQKPSSFNGRKRKNEDGGVDLGVGVSGEFVVNNRSTRARSSINHSVVNGGLASNLRLPSFPDGGSRIVRGLRTPMVQKRRGFYQGYDGGEKEVNKVEKEDDDSDNDGDEEEVATQLAAEIKGFAEKFVKMEIKKLEMMRDVERYRLEMENKRMEMILQSQRMLVEMVNKAFGGSYKPHTLSAK